MKKLSAKDMAHIALFASLTAVGAFIKIPLPLIPFTLQTFFVSLAGILLGAKKGMMSQIVYVVMGLAGLPIFAKGGGPGYVVQPSFGYLIGFIISSYVVGKLAERMKRAGILKIYTIVIAGLLLVYAAGVPYLYLITNLYIGNVMPVGKALYYGFTLTIGGDLLSLYLASVIAAKLLPIFRKTEIVQTSPRQQPKSNPD